MDSKKLICKLFHRSYAIKSGSLGFKGTKIIYMFCWKCGRKWEQILP